MIAAVAAEVIPIAANGLPSPQHDDSMSTFFTCSAEKSFLILARQAHYLNNKNGLFESLANNVSNTLSWVDLPFALKIQRIRSVASLSSTIHFMR